LRVPSCWVILDSHLEAMLSADSGRALSRKHSSPKECRGILSRVADDTLSPSSGEPSPLCQTVRLEEGSNTPSPAVTERSPTTGALEMVKGDWSRAVQPSGALGASSTCRFKRSTTAASGRSVIPSSGLLLPIPLPKHRQPSAAPATEGFSVLPTPTTDEALSGRQSPSMNPASMSPASMSPAAEQRSGRRSPMVEQLQEHANRLEQASLRASGKAARQMLAVAYRERRRSRENVVEPPPADGALAAVLGHAGACSTSLPVYDTYDESEGCAHLRVDPASRGSPAYGAWPPPPAPRPLECLIESLHALLGCDATLR